MRNTRWLSACVLGLSLAAIELPIVIQLAMPAAYAQAVPAEVREGYALLAKGYVGDAIAAFQRAVQRYPQSVEAQLGLAIAYRRNGQDADAFQAYQQVLAIDPNNQLALRSIGLLGGFKPEWQVQGIQALTTLLTLNPNDAEARAQRALLLGYQGRFAEALADYQIALQGNPSPDVLLGAAQVYSYNGSYQQSLDLFNRYQQASGKPIQGYAVVAYARALRNTGSASQAVQYLEAQLSKSNKIDDTTIQLRVELSQAYLATGQQTQAIAILDPLRGRSDAILPLARGLNELGQKLGQPQLSLEAVTLYRQALAQTPNPSPVLLKEVADVLSGQPQERPYALQLYQQVAQSEPGDRALQIKIIALQSQLGQISALQARQQLQALVQPLPSDPAQQQAIAQALTSIDPAPELLPIYLSLIQSGAAANVPFLNFRIAQILIDRNDLAGARNALAAYTATPQGQNDLAPQLLAAEIERKEGNLEGSARRYEAIIAVNPADSDVLVGALRGLAGVRLAQGRPGEALLIYDQLVARNPQDLQLQLGRASVAYQARQMSEAEAYAVLNNWLRTRPATDMPPELYSLVGTLPPNPQLEPLYAALAAADPTYLPVQLRLVQVIAQRDPAAARAQVTRIVALNRSAGSGASIEAYLLQGQLAQAVGDSALANQAYQEVLAKQPDNVEALVGLGNVRFSQRQYDSAQQYYTQALAFQPNNLEVRRSLIELNVVQDYWLTAMQQMEQLQIEQGWSADVGLAQRRQKLGEDFLQRRGFQPPWERY